MTIGGTASYACLRCTDLDAIAFGSADAWLVVGDGLRRNGTTEGDKSSYARNAPITADSLIISATHRRLASNFNSVNRSVPSAAQTN